MTAFETCSGLDAGASVISCFVAEASYFPTIAVLIVLWAIIFFRLELEPTRSRFATSLFAVLVVAMLLTPIGILPSTALSPLIVATIFSVAVMYWK